MRKSKTVPVASGSKPIVVSAGKRGFCERHLWCACSQRCFRESAHQRRNGRCGWQCRCFFLGSPKGSAQHIRRCLVTGVRSSLPHRTLLSVASRLLFPLCGISRRYIAGSCFLHARSRYAFHYIAAQMILIADSSVQHVRSRYFQLQSISSLPTS